MAFKKNEIEFESDKVKVYVQQIQAINAILNQEREELKNIITVQSRDMHDKKQQIDQLKADNEKLQNAIKEVRKIAKGHDYWSSNLRMATDVIYEIIDKCDEILGDNN